MREIDFMSVGKFKVGHAHDVDGGSGCTVLLPDNVATAGVSIKGGGPASREVHLLDPLMAADGVHGILLSGGSAFGLDAAGGVMQFLEEHGVGFDVGVTKVPLVCQSCLFDLMIGSKDCRPDKRMAYSACESASYDMPKSGNVGAGIGCSIGKIRGNEYATKSGIGFYAIEVGTIKVGAMVAVNALGDVFDGQSQIGGLLSNDKQGFQSTEDVLYSLISRPAELFSGNTTLAVVVTNCAFSKAQMNKIADMAHNGYAKTICPVHTTADGDSIYAVSVGDEVGDINAVGTLAARVVAGAVLNAVRSSVSAYGLAAANDISKM